MIDNKAGERTGGERTAGKTTEGERTGGDSENKMNGGGGWSSGLS